VWEREKKLAYKCKSCEKNTDTDIDIHVTYLLLVLEQQCEAAAAEVAFVEPGAHGVG
jgi:hypothetical protein